MSSFIKLFLFFVFMNNFVSASETCHSLQNKWSPGWGISSDKSCSFWWNNDSWGAKQDVQKCFGFWADSQCGKLCCEMKKKAGLLAIDGKWSNYGSYSVCSKSCDGGSQFRERSCTNPAPSNGGNQCTGLAMEIRACNVQSCPVDGKWSIYGSWSTCSKDCGSGNQYRGRTCTNPRPSNGGKTCSGMSLETRECNTESCDQRRTCEEGKLASRKIYDSFWVRWERNYDGYDKCSECTCSSDGFENCIEKSQRCDWELGIQCPDGQEWAVQLNEDGMEDWDACCPFVCSELRDYGVGDYTKITNYDFHKDDYCGWNNGNLYNGQNLTLAIEKCDSSDDCLCVVSYDYGPRGFFFDAKTYSDHSKFKTSKNFWSHMWKKKVTTINVQDPLEGMQVAPGEGVCNDITDRETCVNSYDIRTQWGRGNQQKCTWCCGHQCGNVNVLSPTKNGCQPWGKSLKLLTRNKRWMYGTTNGEFDTCTELQVGDKCKLGPLVDSSWVDFLDRTNDCPAETTCKINPSTTNNIDEEWICASAPTRRPTTSPTSNPTTIPITIPTSNPTTIPTSNPTISPTSIPTTQPTSLPTSNPTTEKQCQFTNAKGKAFCELHAQVWDMCETGGSWWDTWACGEFCHCTECKNILDDNKCEEAKNVWNMCSSGSNWWTRRCQKTCGQC